MSLYCTSSCGRAPPPPPPPSFAVTSAPLHGFAGLSQWRRISHQDRARRREANKTPPPSPRSRRDGELDGTPGSVSKAGQNPFKKEKIAVSRFDVSDIRKVEFVGSFEDNESQWPKVGMR